MLMRDASHPELVPSYPKRLEAVIVVKSKVLNKDCEYLCTGYFFFFNIFARISSRNFSLCNYGVLCVEIRGEKLIYSILEQIKGVACHNVDHVKHCEYYLDAL